MKPSEIRILLEKLSEEDKEQVENTIWFLKEDCISDFDYINNALKLAELINNLKEKYDRYKRKNIVYWRYSCYTS
jgi:hypothetical protein